MIDSEYVHDADGDGLTVNTRECWAMRLLHDDGWTKKELRMTMQVSSYETVALHVSGECGHADLPEGVR